MYIPAVSRLNNVQMAKPIVEVTIAMKSHVFFLSEAYAALRNTANLKIEVAKSNYRAKLVLPNS